MDRFGAVAGLEWWANRSTCLGIFSIDVVAHAGDEGWRASATLLPDTDTESFRFFCDFDPHFTLRFPDGSTIDVAVATRADGTGIDLARIE